MELLTRYLELGLRLGRHADTLVDAYFGPAELRERVEAEEPQTPVALAEEADALLAELREDATPEPARRDWLADQLRALATYARLVAGEDVAFSDEVERCFGVRPTRTPEATFEEAHARLDELLPGAGPLVERYEAWREPAFVAPDSILPAFDAIAAVLREATRRRYGLPDREGVETHVVREEPWLAYNWYRGGRRSRIEVNVDLPITAAELVEIVAHETYPGHHTERAWKEALLVDEGVVEESLVLLPTPQSMLSEAIAETALEAVRDDAVVAELDAALAGVGVETDLREAFRVRDARRPLTSVGLNVGFLLHENGASEDEAAAYAMRWDVLTEDYARKTVSFVADRLNRGYVATYSIGGDLARRHVRDDDARFRRLLTEHVRVADLLPVSSAP